jgi:SAM-dependent methyltransferase
MTNTPSIYNLGTIGPQVALEDGSGAVDTLPEIPAVRERCGRDVLHCQYRDRQYALRSPSAHVLSVGFWEARYAEANQIWSGNPNPQLVASIRDHAPGTALDVGCGEGADAIWLAERGWRVTAMDVSQRALERAQIAAAQAGAEIANRITWLHQDVLTWNEAGAQFDLVSAQYLHFTRDNATLHRRLAALVRPGGSLLIVGHHPSHLQADHDHESTLNPKDLLFEPEAVAASLDAAEWQVQLSAIVERQPSSAHRQSGAMLDTVFLARRTNSSLRV